VHCPFAEVFFGGARGGGKTDGVLGKWALKERRHGKNFNAIAFRRTTVSSEDAIERAKQIYEPLGAKWNASKLIFRMPHGGRVSFKYLESVKDAEEYQGRNLSDAWVEECGQYPSPEPIDMLFGALRSTAGVPEQLILTGNPGGAGQHWIKERYKLNPFPLLPQVVARPLPDGSVHEMAVIPSRLSDNKILTERSANYQSRLYLVGSKELVKAWLEGDWSSVPGAFFDCWSEARHVVQPFRIPDHWLRFAAMDWGSASPFSVGWYAVASDQMVVEGSAPGRKVTIPRGCLVKYREWYGADDKHNGLKLSNAAIAEGIKQREKGDTIAYRVLDPACFAENGGPSIAEEFARAGVHFKKADNTRVSRGGVAAGPISGWAQLRSRLLGNAKDMDEVERTPAMLVFTTACKDTIRTLPVLQHDRSHPEDVDTTNEDHAPDETRYACNSRPWVPGAPNKPKPRDGWDDDDNDRAISWKVA
jgi:hypothetical protein